MRGRVSGGLGFRRDGNGRVLSHTRRWRFRTRCRRTGPGEVACGNGAGNCGTEPARRVPLAGGVADMRSVPARTRVTVARARVLWRLARATGTTPPSVYTSVRSECATSAVRQPPQLCLGREWSPARSDNGGGGAGPHKHGATIGQRTLTTVHERGRSSGVSRLGTAGPRVRSFHVLTAFRRARRPSPPRAGPRQHTLHRPLAQAA
jgi:hypothetical protein